MSKYQLKNKKQITKHQIKQILEWCKNRLGKSKYFPAQDLKLRINNSMPLLGQFDISNITIYINPTRHRNKIELTETLIHEYVHFLQNPKEYDRLWRKNNYEDYFDHPHEEEAERIALSLAKTCIKELKKFGPQGPC